MVITKCQDTTKTVFFHLYNDFSGSPTILRNVIAGFIAEGMDVELVTSKGGILDTIDEKYCRRHSFRYRFSKYPLLTIFRFVRAQLYMFLFAFRYAFRKNTVFYINTILPVGPAIAGRLTGKRIICHCHENAWMKGRVYKELSRVMTLMADEIICVSEYQRNTLADKRHSSVVPNSVSDRFRAKLHPDPEKAFHRREILMACSARMYKGIDAFMNVAYRLPQYHFTLILNARENDVDTFFKDNHLHPPENLTLRSMVTDIHNYYNKSSLVLNLSDRYKFIETFGMTIAEGLCAGLPCIVPVVGGVRELVEENVTGYHIDSMDTDTIVRKIDCLFRSRDSYCTMSRAALASSGKFNEKVMLESIMKIVGCGK